MKITVFHEPWWLSAVSGGLVHESVVKRGNDVVGRLPYVFSRKGPFRLLRMPAFTHVLGPVVDSGDGKPQTRLTRRLAITQQLIDQLPSTSELKLCLDPSLDDGLAKIDGLAFQDRKCSVAPQFTFEIDCRRSLDDLLAALDLKTRQHIRRAEKTYHVRSLDQPEVFIDFYLKNLTAFGRTSRIGFDNFPVLFSECRARECGIILSLFNENDEPIAMTFLVWGHGTMYYLLSTRSRHSHDSGAISLLLWSAIKKAHELGLFLDLDGIYSSGTARFLANFGGKLKTRLVVRRSRMPYSALQYVKAQYSGNESNFFT
ncbi:GNAT family N-acetyltransferase [Bradyrhizobium symbiodeficiens]|uniref:GNAT family N-acetyltransferase n=1 Tax=Bradyrhizobium symbiodeficiens TaxID=1404367 RepID=UPI001FCEDF61|nr:GNAT family N-acetyltransferase [Bradyrhizobium symbiodeficiens]